MKHSLALILIVAACLAGCATALANEDGAMPGLRGFLKKDMAYADLRAAVLARGWKPVPIAECKKNVGGDTTICDHLPELESCSGDGYCISHFARLHR